MAGRPPVDPVLDADKLFDVSTRRQIAVACKAPGQSVQQIAKSVGKPSSAISQTVLKMAGWGLIEPAGVTSRTAPKYLLSKTGTKLYKEWMAAHEVGFQPGQTVVWVGPGQAAHVARVLLDGEHDRDVAFAVAPGRPASLLMAFRDDMPSVRLEALVEALGPEHQSGRVTTIMKRDSFHSFVEGLLSGTPDDSTPNP